MNRSPGDTDEPAAKEASSPVPPAPPKRGRPANPAASQILELLQTDMCAPEIAEKVGCPIDLVYRVKFNSNMAGKRMPRKQHPMFAKVHDLLKTDMSIADIAQKVGCMPALVYRIRAASRTTAAPKSGQIRELLQADLTTADIAKKVGCDVSYVYSVKARSNMAGKRLPRQPRATNPASMSAKVHELMKSGMSPADIAQKVGCHVGLVYNIRSRTGMSRKIGPRPARPARSARSAPGTPGRPRDPASKSGQIRQLLQAGVSIADIAERIGCSVKYVYDVRAKSGLVAKRDPGQPSQANPSSMSAGPPKRGPERPAPVVPDADTAPPPKVAAHPDEDAVASVVALVQSMVQGVERDRARLREALERIQAVIADVLA